MSVLRAHVKDGHLVIDEPVDLPEGTVVDLVAIDSEDSLDDAERAALRAAIVEGLAEADRGDIVDADIVLAQLRQRSA